MFLNGAPFARERAGGRMLFIVVLLLVLWFLGFMTSTTLGGLLHVTGYFQCPHSESPPCELAVRYDDAIATRRGGKCRGPADAAAAAGDDHNLIGQICPRSSGA